MTKINKEEYETLKKLGDKWKWIARNRDGGLYKFQETPEKIDSFRWNDRKQTWLGIYGNLFQFIQWENEEPYNIAELIEEYEDKEFYDYVGWEHHKREKSEVKGIEWLKEEVWKQDIVMDKGYIYTDDLMSIINEVDEPEVKQLERKIKELDSYNDELIRDNNQFRNELDNQEVLSEEWIERNTSPVDDEGRLYVWKSDLQNAIVPKQDEREQLEIAYKDILSRREFLFDDKEYVVIEKQELPVIPKFVANWIEETKKQYKTLIFAFTHIYAENEIGESPSKEEKRLYQWMESADNEEVFARAWLDGFMVEMEQKYYVMNNDNRMMLVRMMDGKTITEADPFKLEDMYEGEKESHRLTEQEIKDYDERYWAFRKPVEEVEE